jgi:hypothetical protein
MRGGISEPAAGVKLEVAEILGPRSKYTHHATSNDKRNGRPRISESQSLVERTQVDGKALFSEKLA